MAGLSSSDTVAVVGAGAMGAGIAQVAATAGHKVLLFDAKPGAAEKGLAGIAKGLAGQVQKGRLSVADSEAINGRIVPVKELAELQPAALVVEAIIEDLAIKQQLLASLEAIVSTQAILASNTSSISITALASKLTHPQRVAGLHFFNPAPVMALVEVVAGLATDPKVVELLLDTAAIWGKKPVRAKSTPGFIVNRVARPFYGEAWRLNEEGVADVSTIDAILREAGGFRMGPFELMDLIGHDVNFAVTSSVFQAYFNDPRYRPSLSQQELVAAGWLGRKSGRGIYDYSPDAAKPAAVTCEPAPAPSTVFVEGNLGAAEPLCELIAAAGISIERGKGEGLIRFPGCTLALSDGKTATQRVTTGGPADLVLFDLALDYRQCGRIAIAKADQAPAAALSAAAGLFQALGKKVSAVQDSPALALMRTLAMLANEAADAVLQGVATPQDIDLAMTYGVNYPRGPLAWADAVGAAHILSVLENLHVAYGDDRYRPSAWLRHRVAGGNSLSGIAAVKQ
jgi:3-hydroxybutyryl-CoA dehydrogenase